MLFDRTVMSVLGANSDEGRAELARRGVADQHEHGPRGRAADVPSTREERHHAGGGDEAHGDSAPCECIVAAVAHEAEERAARVGRAARGRQRDAAPALIRAPRGQVLGGGGVYGGGR